MSAASEGFALLTRENLTLGVQQISHVDFALKFRIVTETIEVSAAVAPLESEQATMGQSIGNNRIVEMPLNKCNCL